MADPRLDGWLENPGFRPGLTRGRKVRIIWANGKEASAAYSSDTATWDKRGFDWDIGWYRIAE